MNTETKAVLIFTIAIISLIVAASIMYSYPDATHLIMFIIVAIAVIYLITKK